jgi:hypothetical protein
LTEQVAKRAQAGDCTHWILVGARFYEREGKTLCSLCAAKHAPTTAERKAILGVP